MNRIKKFIIHLKETPKRYLNSCVIFFGLIFVTEVLILLDFLPKIIDQPEFFQDFGTCKILNLSITPNLCLTGNEVSNRGGVENFWKTCYLASFSINYISSQVNISSLSNSLISGTCNFIYPESFANNLALLKEIKKEYQIGHEYSCWINSPENQCYLVDLDKMVTAFGNSQIFMGCLFVLSIISIIYLNKLHNRNKFAFTAI